LRGAVQGEVSTIGVDIAEWCFRSTTSMRWTVGSAGVLVEREFLRMSTTWPASGFSGGRKSYLSRSNGFTSKAVANLLTVSRLAL
jgi:hypothetical protein